MRANQPIQKLLKRIKARRREAGESGQATIEFALTLLFMLTLVFFYIQLGLVMAVANYAQYATFMAARAYFAGGLDEADQLQRATSVVTKMLKSGEGQSADRWPALASGKDGDQLKGVKIGRGAQFREKDKSYSWQEGVRYSFRSRMIALPGAEGGGDSAIELSTESWLGREPGFTECSEYMTTVGGIIDNGC